MKFTKENPLVNFFPKGKTPRSNQVKALNQIGNSFLKKTKFTIVSAPTGSGKSLIAATIANAANDITPEYQRLVKNYDIHRDSDGADKAKEIGKEMGAYVLTTTKSLQSQYDEEFNGFSQVLKGKGNYQCKYDEDFSVDIAPCILSPRIREECFACDKCLYFNQANRTFLAKMGVLNYSKYLNLPPHQMSREVIIGDECSELEKEIVNRFSITLNYKTLRGCGVDVAKLKTDAVDKVRVWINDLSDAVKEKVESFKPSKSGGRKLGDITKYRYLNELSNSIELVCSTWNICEYVSEFDDDGVKIVPFRVNVLAPFMFSDCKHVILMSAYMGNHKKFASDLGIKEYEYVEVESEFDSEKSPIYCSTKYPLSYKTMKANLPKVIGLIEQIVERHEGEKGLIHTQSFEITQALQKVLKGKRFLFREDGATNETIVAEHALRSDDTVLISPSLTMGLDLKGDLGKWQIIIKLPYPPLSDKRIKKLFDTDKVWYQQQMLKQLVQAAGRCTRTKEDESITYILDGNIEKVLYYQKKDLPKHFLERFQ